MRAPSREGQIAAGLANFKVDMRAIFMKLDDRFERGTPDTLRRNAGLWKTAYWRKVEKPPTAGSKLPLSL